MPESRSGAHLDGGHGWVDGMEKEGKREREREGEKRREREREREKAKKTQDGFF